MRCVTAASNESQQFGGAEVEQLGLAGGRDEDVGRLEIEMNHQVAVGVGDGLADALEQADARAGVELSKAAVFVKPHTFDVLHHQIRRAGIAGAAIENMGNAGMIETGQDLRSSKKDRRDALEAES